VRPVYIVLSAAGVGGAEKRFTDNWLALRRLGMDIHLVMDPRTHAGLSNQPAYTEAMASRSHLHLLDMGGGQYRSYCQSVSKFFAQQPGHGIVHYPLAYVPWVQTRHRHKLIVSWVDSAMPPWAAGRWRSGLGAWAGLLMADQIDVLNPSNLEHIQRVPGLASRATLTAGGTQIDASRYRPRGKRLDFIFLGRAEAEKQALRLVQTLPQVHRRLQQAGHDGYRFAVYGDGREASAISALAASPEFTSTVPFDFGYAHEPDMTLGAAAVFFSLQRTSNYPSKALAEAMACGAYPIITEVGESALMVEGLPHRAFVPRDFSADDISNALLHYLSARVDDRQRWSEEIAAFAARRFAPGSQVAYFAELYRRLGAA